MTESIKSYSRNNFDFLRLLFSSTVIISHSYPLTQQPEWFYKVTNGQFDLGSLSVNCFFIMSGYLIFTSMLNSKTILSYLWKRVLRLFPAIFGMLLVTGIVLSVVTRDATFVLSSPFLQYCINVLSLYNMPFTIGDIFSENPYHHTINGSLWSLSYEFTMYLVVASLFFIKDKKYTKYIILIGYLGCSILYMMDSSFLKNLIGYFKLGADQVYRLSAFFLAGSLLTYIDLKKYNSLRLRTILLAIILFSLLVGQFKIVSVIILPVYILLVGLASTPYLNSIASKTGDLSYGIYVYAFLIQQTLLHYFQLSTWELTLYTFPITYLLAYASWHLIEKKMMTYKKLVK